MRKTPVCVYPPLYFRSMCASKGNVAQTNLWFKALFPPASGASTLFSPSLIHHGADTSWTLLILIRESIKFHCRNSYPGFELCWLGRYIMSWQDVSSVTMNRDTQRWGEATKGQSLIHWIITATLWKSEQGKSPGHRLDLKNWHIDDDITHLYRCEHLVSPEARQKRITRWW